MIASTQTNHPLAFHTDNSPNSHLDTCCQRLRSSGLRITQPRIAILTSLIKKSTPTTIEDIHQDLGDVGCDLVTVYRCLAAFEELGIVRRFHLHNGTSVYQIQIDGAPGYHVMSKDGTQVTNLADSLSQKLRSVIREVELELEAQGHTGVTHSLEFYSSGKMTAPSHRVNLGHHISG